jgi:hypothetical protein
MTSPAPAPRSTASALPTAPVLAIAVCIFDSITSRKIEAATTKPGSMGMGLL